MLLLLDIGNTHTHLGLADAKRIVRQTDIPTRAWLEGAAPALVRRFTGSAPLIGAALCSVVPRATSRALPFLRKVCAVTPLHLRPQTLAGVGIRYPHPETIGPDRL